ncbi:MAG: hypothetical protein K2M79_06100 [Muribaculaceae bacterium]|nr:hypothetical protein [Muribaculaceae bacterium]
MKRLLFLSLLFLTGAVFTVSRAALPEALWFKANLGTEFDEQGSSKWSDAVEMEKTGDGKFSYTFEVPDHQEFYKQQNAYIGILDAYEDGDKWTQPMYAPGNELKVTPGQVVPLYRGAQGCIVLPTGKYRLDIIANEAGSLTSEVTCLELPKRLFVYMDHNNGQGWVLHTSYPIDETGHVQISQQIYNPGEYMCFSYFKTPDHSTWIWGDIGVRIGWDGTNAYTAQSSKVSNLPMTYGDNAQTIMLPYTGEYLMALNFTEFGKGSFDVDPVNINVPEYYTQMWYHTAYGRNWSDATEMVKTGVNNFTVTLNLRAGSYVAFTSVDSNHGWPGQYLIGPAKVGGYSLTFDSNGLKDVPCTDAGDCFSCTEDGRYTFTFNIIGDKTGVMNISAEAFPATTPIPKELHLLYTTSQYNATWTELQGVTFVREKANTFTARNVPFDPDLYYSIITGAYSGPASYSTEKTLGLAVEDATPDLLRSNTLQNPGGSMKFPGGTYDLTVTFSADGTPTLSYAPPKADHIVATDLWYNTAENDWKNHRRKMKAVEDNTFKYTFRVEAENEYVAFFIAATDDTRPGFNYDGALLSTIGDVDVYDGTVSMIYNPQGTGAFHLTTGSWEATVVLTADNTGYVVWKKTDPSAMDLTDVNMPLKVADFKNGKKHYFLVGTRMGTWRLQPEWEFMPDENGRLVIKEGIVQGQGNVGIACVDNYTDYVTHRYTLYGNAAVINSEGEEETGPEQTTDANGTNGLNLSIDLAEMGEASAQRSDYTNLRWHETGYALDYNMPVAIKETVLTLDENGVPAHLEFNDILTEEKDVLPYISLVMVGEELGNDDPAIYDYDRAYLHHCNNSETDRNWTDAWVQYDPTEQTPYVDGYGDYLYHTNYSRRWLSAHPSLFTFTHNGVLVQQDSRALTFQPYDEYSKEDRDSDPYSDYYENAFAGRKIQTVASEWNGKPIYVYVQKPEGWEQLHVHAFNNTTEYLIGSSYNDPACEVSSFEKVILSDGKEYYRVEIPAMEAWVRFHDALRTDENGNYRQSGSIMALDGVVFQPKYNFELNRDITDAPRGGCGIITDGLEDSDANIAQGSATVDGNVSWYFQPLVDKTENDAPRYKAYVLKNVWLAGTFKVFSGFGGVQSGSIFDWTHSYQLGPDIHKLKINASEIDNLTSLAAPTITFYHMSATNGLDYDFGATPVFAKRVIMWVNEDGKLTDSYLQIVLQEYAPEIVASVMRNAAGKKYLGFDWNMDLSGLATENHSVTSIKIERVKSDSMEVVATARTAKKGVIDGSKKVNIPLEELNPADWSGMDLNADEEGTYRYLISLVITEYDKDGNVIGNKPVQTLSNIAGFYNTESALRVNLSQVMASSGMPTLTLRADVRSRSGLLSSIVSGQALADYVEGVKLSTPHLPTAQLLFGDAENFYSETARDGTTVYTSKTIHELPLTNEAITLVNKNALPSAMEKANADGSVENIGTYELKAEVMWKDLSPLGVVDITSYGPGSDTQDVQVNDPTFEMSEVYAGKISAEGHYYANNGDGSVRPYFAEELHYKASDNGTLSFTHAPVNVPSGSSASQQYISAWDASYSSPFSNGTVSYVNGVDHESGAFNPLIIIADAENSRASAPGILRGSVKEKTVNDSEQVHHKYEYHPVFFDEVNTLSADMSVNPGYAEDKADYGTTLVDSRIEPLTTALDFDGGEAADASAVIQTVELNGNLRLDGFHAPEPGEMVQYRTSGNLGSTDAVGVRATLKAGDYSLKFDRAELTPDYGMLNEEFAAPGALFDTDGRDNVLFTGKASAGTVTYAAALKTLYIAPETNLVHYPEFTARGQYYQLPDNLLSDDAAVDQDGNPNIEAQNQHAELMAGHNYLSWHGYLAGEDDGEGGNSTFRGGYKRFRDSADSSTESYDPDKNNWSRIIREQGQEGFHLIVGNVAQSPANQTPSKVSATVQFTATYPFLVNSTKPFEVTVTEPQTRSVRRAAASYDGSSAPEHEFMVMAVPGKAVTSNELNVYNTQTGVEDVIADSRACVTLSPNPVQTTTVIRGGRVLGDVTVHSLNGSCVKRVMCDDTALTLDVTDIADGVYVVNTAAGQTKMIVKK